MPNAVSQNYGQCLHHMSKYSSYYYTYIHSDIPTKIDSLLLVLHKFGAWKSNTHSTLVYLFRLSPHILCVWHFLKLFVKSHISNQYTKYLNEYFTQSMSTGYFVYDYVFDKRFQQPFPNWVAGLGQFKNDHLD